MDFKEIIEINNKKYIQPYLDANDEVAFINAVKFPARINLNGSIDTIKLYEYQEAFFLNLHLNDHNVVIKCRQGGYTTLIALHIIYELYNAYSNNNEYPGKFMYVAPNMGIAEELKKRINALVRFCHNKENFHRFVALNVLYATENNYMEKLCGQVVKEAFIDEFAFMKNPCELISGISTYTNKITLISSYGDKMDEKKIEKVKNYMESLYKERKEDYSYTETHWWEVPYFNKNLMWKKLEAEPIIDDEGNVKYDKEAWDKRIADGWIPTSEKYEQLIKIGVKEKELLN